MTNVQSTEPDRDEAWVTRDAAGVVGLHHVREHRDDGHTPVVVIDEVHHWDGRVELTISPTS